MIRFQLHEVSRIVERVETESKLMVTGAVDGTLTPQKPCAEALPAHVMIFGDGAYKEVIKGR